MAKQLVSAMTGVFRPEDYKDEYREALEKIIEAKVDGRETVEVEEPEPEGKLIDLMAALEASVSAATASRKEPVSVSEAKAAREQRAEKAEKAEKAKPAARRTVAKAKSDDDEEAAAASGSRRKRKSA